MPRLGDDQAFTFAQWKIIKSLESFLVNRLKYENITEEQVWQIYQDAKGAVVDENGEVMEGGAYTAAFGQAVAASAAEIMGTGPGGLPEALPDDTTTESGETPAQRERRIRKEKRRRAETRVNSKSGLFNELSTLGINVTPNVQQLVQEALNHHYNNETFLRFLRQTPEYQERFVGIFDEDGNLQMSETAYLQTERSYQDIAAQAGLNISTEKLQGLFLTDTSPGEFKVKAGALKQLKTNPELYEQFRKSLIQEGVADAGTATRENLWKFVMGEGNAEWADVWNLSRTRYAATQAGIKLAKGADSFLALNPHLVEKLANRGLSDEALSAGFDQVAQSLLTVLPLSHIQGMGLNKRDLTQAAFGGKRSAATKQKIRRILETQKSLADDSGTSTAVYGTQGGGVTTQGGQGGANYDQA